jgi:hypothetical protein
MPTIFSNLFNSSGTVEAGVGALTEELALDTQKRASAGFSHARVRRTHARVGLGTVAGVSDQVRMLTLKSSDRLYSLLLSSDGGSTAGDADLGFYKTGDAHDGALPSTNSVDCFSSTAVATDTAANRVEHFVLGDFDEENMGLQVWELINISDGATYTSDPGGTFDITFTMTVASTVALNIVQLEAFYTAGD